MAKHDARDLYDGNPSGWPYDDDPSDPSNGKEDWEAEVPDDLVQDAEYNAYLERGPSVGEY